ncbi:MAG: B12-binding domain-containing radical SAM protein [Bacteroidales bacterium]|nr:B12-binding domain-containing radical SAM protein [Bacteroidales bacterium]
MNFCIVTEGLDTYMKITLIQLYNTFVQQGQIWYAKKRKMGYAPTTLPSLAASIPKELGVEITLIDEGVELVDVDAIDADVVGLSVMTPNAFRAYEMADKLRKRGIITILGGFHPTLMPDEAREHADAIVRGFAEVSFPKLINDIIKNKLQKEYSDSCAETFEHQMYAPMREKLKLKRYFLPTTLELTRGCVNQCSFCSIPAFCEGRYLKRDIDQVIEELRPFSRKRITFLDSSPPEDSGYIKEFYRKLIPLKLKWYSCATMKQAADEEWLDLAVRSGCKGVLIGFESIHKESVQEGRKLFNQVDKYAQFIYNLHKKGIAVLGTFMFGFDHDKPDIFRRTAEFVDKTRMDLIHYAIFTPFPGTPDFKRLEREGRIITRNWALYDGTHAVYNPSGMSREQLENGYFWASKRSHTMRSVFTRTFGSAAGSLFTLLGNVGFRQLANVLVPTTFNYEEYED